MKLLKRKTITLIFLTLLCLLCFLLINFWGEGPNAVLKLGPIVLNANTKSGIFTGLMSLIYIFLVYIDYKKGFVIALTFSFINVVNIMKTIIILKTLAPFPGIITNLVSTLSIIIIYLFFKRLSIGNLTDYVTGQGNRRSYVKDIRELLQTGKSFTVACIELEEFQHINDLYGIQTGDFFLKQLTKKIEGILEKNDKIYRITGSTFAVVFHPGNSPEERLNSISHTDTIILPPKDNESNTEISSTMSIKIGLYYSNPPYNSSITASKILNKAETALIETRNSTSKKLCTYNEKMENLEVKQREAEYLVKDALEKGYFYMVYQPQYTCSEKKLRGFETLIRCKKPNGEIISPGFFIPASEKSNLIMKIDEYVLRKSMKEFNPLLQNEDSSIILSINVSAKSMGSQDFAYKVEKLVNELNFPPKNLEIEITEYSFAESMEYTISNINQLRSLGIQIALDDFGTGYTSIKQMMKLPINLLKIDKSLIDDIEDNQSMRDIVDSVIYMGHVMNCEVISEGVEKEEQLKILKDHKCDFIQGFIWGKPISFDDAKELINTSLYSKLL
ncbi:MAG: EAL domain-containing protein [Treponema sp.]|nr:EAL domain-containing protein [Treponema sp.]